MARKLSLRQAKKNIAEQYYVNISMRFIKDMGITPEDREVEIKYDEDKKAIIILKCKK